MSTVTIDVSKNKVSRINLGVQGENIVEKVVFNIAEWVEEYGEGVAYIYAKRRGDEEPYPVALEMDLDAQTATWDLTLTDTAAKGKGSAQFVYIVDEDEDSNYEEDEIKKTKVYATTVQSSLVASSEENPSGYETWLEVLGGYTARIEAANIAAQQAKAAAIEAQEAAEAAQTAAETAQGNSEDSAEDSEAYAKGTRGGTDVSSDDPAYHANSYYYSQLAYNSAVDAIAAEGNSESSAETSEAYAVGKRDGSDVTSKFLLRPTFPEMVIRDTEVDAGDIFFGNFFLNRNRNSFCGCFFLFFCFCGQFLRHLYGVCTFCDRFRRFSCLFHIRFLCLFQCRFNCLDGLFLFILFI